MGQAPVLDAKIDENIGFSFGRRKWPNPSRPPHEHRLDLADSEELGILVFEDFGRQYMVCFRWQ
jgi:hypothetical protein